MKQLFAILDEKIKQQLPYLMLVFVLSSFLDVISLGLIGLFLAFAMDPLFLMNRMPNTIKAYLLTIDPAVLMTMMGGLIILAFIIKAVLGIGSQAFIARSIGQLSIRLKNKLVLGYQQASYLFHLHHHSSHLIHQVSQIDMATKIISNLLTMLSCVLVMLGIGLFLLISHPLCTLSLSLLLLIIYGVNDWAIKRKTKKLGQSLAMVGAGIHQYIAQSLLGLQEIRLLHKEDFFLDGIKAQVSAYGHALAANQALQSMPKYIFEAGFAGLMIAFMLGTVWLGADVEHIIPLLGIFAAAGLRLLPTMTQLMNALNQTRIAWPALACVYQAFEDIKHYHTPDLAEKILAKLPFSVFQLNNVFFYYPNSPQCILNNITLFIQKGEAIGLVGKTGAGKSTLVNLILGLLQPTQGVLSVDGKPIPHLRHWMNNFAYIPQQIFLLDASLRDNIAMGVPKDHIDPEKLEQAIRMAQLSEVIEHLPQGVDTLVGENGIRLSGGQRQRVALARAFYHERDIIVMDEATSALDNETEKALISAIKQLKGVKTLIIIAHRLSTIEHCDKVYRLADGLIEESPFLCNTVSISSDE